MFWLPAASRSSWRESNDNAIRRRIESHVILAQYCHIQRFSGIATRDHAFDQLGSWEVIFWQSQRQLRIFLTERSNHRKKESWRSRKDVRKALITVSIAIKAYYKTTSGSSDFQPNLERVQLQKMKRSTAKMFRVKLTLSKTFFAIRTWWFGMWFREMRQNLAGAEEITLLIN
jgi:hypothetical protein